MKNFVRLIIAAILLNNAYCFGNQFELERIGSSYGGWTIPKNILTNSSVIYSVGAGEDISFDLELVRRYGCNVVIIDPTPRAIEHYDLVVSSIKHGEASYSIPDHNCYELAQDQLSNLTFLPCALWDVDTTLEFFLPKNPTHVSCSIVNMQSTNNSIHVCAKKLSTIMKERGEKHIDLLKIDIEGAEYQVLENILKEEIYPDILCIEFHDVKEFNREDTIKQILTHGYIIADQHNHNDITFMRRTVSEYN